MKDDEAWSLPAALAAIRDELGVPPMDETQQRINQLRRQADEAQSLLHYAIVAACPGPHEPKQHRDRRPPWCKVCRRDGHGEQVPSRG